MNSIKELSTNVTPLDELVNNFNKLINNTKYPYTLEEIEKGIRTEIELLNEANKLTDLDDTSTVESLLNWALSVNARFSLSRIKRWIKEFINEEKARAKALKAERLIPLGFDTEYEDDKNVSLQIAIEKKWIDGKQIELNNRIPRILKFKGLKDDTGREFIGFYIDARDVAIGKETRDLFSEVLTHLTGVLNLPRNEDGSLICTVKYTLYAFYNNAEIGRLMPFAKDITSVMKEQGDTPNLSLMPETWRRNDKHNLKLIPIQSSLLIDNYRYKLPKGVSCKFTDARWITGNGDLETFSKASGIKKVEGIDFNKHSATWYFDNECELWYDYSIVDAIAVLSNYLLFMDKFREAVQLAYDSDLISDESKDKLIKYIDDFTTTPAFASKLYYANLEHRGLADRYKWHKEHCNNKLPKPLVTKLIGGDNSYDADYKPNLYKNIRFADVKSAYLTATKVFKMPLTPVTMNPNWACVKGVRNITWLAKELDRYKYEAGYVSIKWDFDNNVPMHCRVFKEYNENGIGVKVSKSSDFIEVNILEILEFAAICRDEGIKCNVEIEAAYIYISDNNPYHIVNFNELCQWLADKRKEYLKSDLMNLVFKLIGNAAYGKIGQFKNITNNALGHDIIYNEGVINRFNSSEFLESEITHIPYANHITALARFILRWSACQAKAIMTVTDSIIYSADSKYDPNKPKKTGYWLLDKYLTAFEWEIEKNGVDIIIAKEREYITIEYKDGISEDDKNIVRDAIESHKGLTDNLIDKHLDIENAKVADRGVKKEKGLSKKELYKKTTHRFLKRYQCQENMPYEVKTMAKVMPWFKEGKRLGEEIVKKSVLGKSDYNPYLSCRDIAEFNMRKKWDEIARKKYGYADILKFQYHDPEGCQQMVDSYKPRPHVHERYDTATYRAIYILNKYHKALTQRELSELLKISQSTINRMIKSVEDSKIPESVEKHLIEQTPADLLNEVMDKLERKRGGKWLKRRLMGDVRAA